MSKVLRVNTLDSSSKRLTLDFRISFDYLRLKVPGYHVITVLLISAVIIQN